MGAGAHGFPLGGEGGVVSCVEDLALWDRNFTTHRVGGPALAEALETQIEFTGGGRNDYACGLRIGEHRGLRTVGHGGLWPGYKTEFMRVPALGVSVICISNNGASDPYHLAHDVLDVFLDGMPGAHPVPPLPPREKLEGMVGRWLDRDSGMTVDIGLDDRGRPTGNTHGIPFRMVPAGDGRLQASRGPRDFLCAPAADGTLAVELDAGVRATCHRVADGAALPEGLAGCYANEEIGAAWTIAEARAACRCGCAGRWPATAAPGRWRPSKATIIRIWIPGALFRSWLDVRVLREGGRATGLHVNGNRARRLVYRRQTGAGMLLPSLH